jgi:urease accessory protein
VNLRLLQLASPSLPVGAYSYSQGLEAAIEAKIVHDAASATQWIGDVLALSLGGFEAPVFLRLAAAWKCADAPSVHKWNATFIATRETSELRAETLQMGYSMRRLLRDLSIDTTALDGMDELAYPTTFTFAVTQWDVDPGEALQASLFAWVENQVLAAIKAVPLGQTDGQRMLLALGERIPAIAAAAARCEDADMGNFAPGLAILSAHHETQYSRIFRS